MLSFSLLPLTHTFASNEGREKLTVCPVCLALGVLAGRSRSSSATSTQILERPRRSVVPPLSPLLCLLADLAVGCFGASSSRGRTCRIRSKGRSREWQSKSLPTTSNAVKRSSFVPPPPSSHLSSIFSERRNLTPRCFLWLRTCSTSLRNDRIGTSSVTWTGSTQS